MRAHYPLQALLYSVALHRYLRWRQPDYDPAVHLGGVQYLFVRGMVGPDTPPGCGVFDWAPPAALIIELSDLLAGSCLRARGDAMTEVQVAQRGKGMLRVFNEAGVLAAADVHVALRLSALGGEASEDVAAGRGAGGARGAVRLGVPGSDADPRGDASTRSPKSISTHCPGRTTASSSRHCGGSPLVMGGSAGPLRPLRLVDTAEGGAALPRPVLPAGADHPAGARPARRRASRSSTSSRCGRAWTRCSATRTRRGAGPGPDRQRIAAALAATQWTTVVAGGPGTGKTHTVARVLALLIEAARAGSRGSRWPHPPARPRRGCRSRCASRPTRSGCHPT